MPQDEDIYATDDPSSGDGAPPRPTITMVTPRGGGVPASVLTDKPRVPGAVTTRPLPDAGFDISVSLLERAWLTVKQSASLIIPTFIQLSMTRNQKITAFIIGLCGLVATNFLGVELSPTIQSVLNIAIPTVLAWLLPAPETKPVDTPDAP
jgi:hypothetical protein